ncbi:replication initiation protein [Clostridium lacusfryxellense]|uniref:replication initiation protein n=1 Tax=Clostridium lacusfryxellense TaxID=205328 RepID=UPI001C0C94A3|nr:replication initiation protein [Clostridium lacusfryxellense]MBU3114756.1 replication initiation protein [Clostridium lacusfryxellense]
MENKLMLNKESWICKDNRLINASYKLNLGELKLILAISSMVNPLDKEFKDYIISIKDFAKLLDVNLSTNKNFYSRIKRASGLLLSKRVTIHESDGDFQTVWLSGIKYYDNEGKVAVSFHPRLIEYYLQLQQYTKYRLKNITDLNSEYSLKLYEILKQYEKVGERIYDLEELKKFLGIENQYNRYYNLKKRILLVTQKEINEKTDIFFEFEEIKEGRSIKAIRFYIKANKTKNKAIEEVCVTLEGKCTNEEEKRFTELINGVKSIFKENISGLQAKSILDTAKGNINIIKEKYEIAKVTPGIKGIVGWMCDAIKRDYQQLKGKAQNGSFNDYEQRSYDFDKLERRLLGWDKTKEDDVGEKYQQGTIE